MLKISLAQISAKRWRDIEKRKELRRHAVAFGPFGNALPGQVGVPTLQGGQMFERSALQSPITEVGRSDSDAVGIFFWNCLPDRNHVAQLGKSERAQQERIHIAEDCGICADSEGQRDYCYDRESKTLS